MVFLMRIITETFNALCAIVHIYGENEEKIDALEMIRRMFGGAG